MTYREKLIIIRRACMKKVVAIGAAALALTLLLAVEIVRHKNEPLRDWQRLPHGGAVRVFAVTYGTWHQIQAPPRGWSERLKDLPYARTPRALFDTLTDKFRGCVGMNDGALVLWLQIDGRTPQSLRFQEAELVLPGLEPFHARGGGGAGFCNDFVYSSASFPIIPQRLKTLRFIVAAEGQRFAFETKNPAYREELPVWQPEPLPQVREAGDFTVTLRDIQLVPARLNADREKWEVHPSWSITKGGEKADEWFNLYAHCSDAGGNSPGLLSESAWKVRCEAWQTERYPFSVTRCSLSTRRREQQGWRSRGCSAPVNSR
jgi:hypothetical protein